MLTQNLFFCVNGHLNWYIAQKLDQETGEMGKTEDDLGTIFEVVFAEYSGWVISQKPLTENALSYYKA
jgi:hypothetical protein